MGSLKQAWPSERVSRDQLRQRGNQLISYYCRLWLACRSQLDQSSHYSVDLIGQQSKIFANETTGIRVTATRSDLQMTGPSLWIPPFQIGTSCSSWPRQVLTLFYLRRPVLYIRSSLYVALVYFLSNFRFVLMNCNSLSVGFNGLDFIVKR